MAEETEIQLYNGGVTRLDKADLALLEGYLGFRTTNMGYVTIHRSNGSLVYLHRYLMGAPKGRLVDHINGDKLDNRRVNLRFVNRAENAWNAKDRSDNTSGARGVWKVGRWWHTRIKIRGVLVLLGEYETRDEASIAYEAARKVRDTLWPAIKESA